MGAQPCTVYSGEGARALYTGKGEVVAGDETLYKDALVGRSTEKHTHD